MKTSFKLPEVEKLNGTKPDPDFLIKRICMGELSLVE